MAINMKPMARAAPTKPDAEARAEAFIAEGIARRASAPAPAPELDDGKRKVVNSRWDADLLERIDKAAKAQGISRTAWLHVAAAEKLAR